MNDNVNAQGQIIFAGNLPLLTLEQHAELSKIRENDSSIEVILDWFVEKTGGSLPGLMVKCILRSFT